MDNSIFIFLSYGTLIAHIQLGQGWLLSNNFCKACQNCLRPSFEFVQFDECTQCSADAWIVALLWKLTQMPSCIHAAQTTRTWTKTILACFTKLIAVQPSMAEYERTVGPIPNDSIMIMLSCTEISSFFPPPIWRNLESNPGFFFFFFFFTHTVYYWIPSFVYKSSSYMRSNS